MDVFFDEPHILGGDQVRSKKFFFQVEQPNMHTPSPPICVQLGPIVLTLVGFHAKKFSILFASNRLKKVIYRRLRGSQCQFRYYLHIWNSNLPLNRQNAELRASTVRKPLHFFKLKCLNYHVPYFTTWAHVNLKSVLEV